MLKIIENAFSSRAMPSEVVKFSKDITSETNDANWFKNKDWHDITWDDWEAHRYAFFSFTPQAFLYYLPSILRLSSERPDSLFLPAEALLQVLDRSPVVEYWDEFILNRLYGLDFKEYEAIAKWIEVLSDSCVVASEDTLGRAFDTIALLQKSSMSNREKF